MLPTLLLLSLAGSTVASPAAVLNRRGKGPITVGLKTSTDKPPTPAALAGSSLAADTRNQNHVELRRTAIPIPATPTSGCLTTGYNGASTSARTAIYTPRHRPQQHTTHTLTTNPPMASLDPNSAESASTPTTNSGAATPVVSSTAGTGAAASSLATSPPAFPGTAQGTAMATESANASTSPASEDEIRDLVMAFEAHDFGADNDFRVSKHTLFRNMCSRARRRDCRPLSRL